MRSPAPRSSSTSADAQTCRAAVGAAARAASCSSSAWAGIRDAVERPALPFAVRLARRLRALGADGGAARRGRLAARCLAGRRLLVAVVRDVGRLRVGRRRRSRRSSSSRRWCPVLGVAAAYGPRQDPLEALIATAPYGRTRLILLRTLGVLVSVLPVTVLLGLALPGPPWLAAAWLGPALALVPVLLALAGFVGPRAAATVVSLVWAASCWSRPGRCPPTWPVEAAQQRCLPRARPWPPVPSVASGRHRPAAGDGVGARQSLYEHRRAHRRQQVVRPHPRPGRRRPRRSTEGSPGCSVPTAPARRRCCASSPRRSPPTAATVRLLGRDPHRSQAEVTAIRRELGYLPQELGYPCGHDRLRVRRVRRRPQGVERPRGPVPGGTPGARRWSGSPTRPRSGSAGCPVGNAGGSGWRRRCSGTRGCSCSTSRRPASTRRSAPTCDVPCPPCGHRSTVLLSTHQTEDVAALCERVVVLAGGTVRFDGAVTDLVATAVGQVWLADEPGHDALVSWRTGTGRHHVVGGRRPVGRGPCRADPRGRLPADARARRATGPHTFLTPSHPNHTWSDR